MKQQPKTLDEINEKLIVGSSQEPSYYIGLQDYEREVRAMLERRIEELDKGGIQEAWMMIELCRIIGKEKG